MNRIKTLIAAGAIATVAAMLSLPAWATEYYVVHRNGQVTREFTPPNSDNNYGYWSFGFGAPGVWYGYPDDDDYFGNQWPPGYFGEQWGPEWPRHWPREHDHWGHHHRRISGDRSDDD